MLGDWLHPALALSPFLVPLPVACGGRAGSFSWRLGPPICQLFLVSEKHHLQLLSGADWIKALTFKCLIGAQVKWGF